MRIITIVNQKGGVGKTTTFLNLGAGLHLAGQRVLLIDLDPQANATYTLLGQTEPDLTTYDVLVGEVKPADAVVSTPLGPDLLPATIDLAGAEIELISAIGGQARLRSRLNSWAAGYDIALIDAPPSLGLLTINALAAATEALVPISMSAFALKGLERLLHTIEQVRHNLNAPHLKIGGLLCTMTETTNVARDVETILRQRFGEQVFKTVIPKNVKLEEAHTRQQSIFHYAPASTGAQAYGDLVQEVLNRG